MSTSSLFFLSSNGYYDDGPGAVRSQPVSTLLGADQLRLAEVFDSTC
jgi:predicted nucleic acid-binding OB-fold protein